MSGHPAIELTVERRQHFVQAAHLGTPIASGRTAEVYAWGDGAVLKLFFPSVSPADVELERHHASVSGECGVDTPAVYETVRKGNRLGLVYERVDGPTLLEKVQTEPEAMEQWGGCWPSLTCPCAGPMSRLVCRIKSSGWRVKWTPAAFCHAKSVPLFWKCWLLFPQDALFATATFIRATSSSPTKGRASSIGSMRRSAIPSPTWLARPSFCWDILKAAASMRTKKSG